MSADRILVGAITGAFGVKGEVRLKSFCAVPEDIGNYSPLYTGDGDALKLKINRPVKGGFAARIADIRFKDQADTLRGTQLFVDREQLPSLPDDEFYHSDLIGLEVFDTGGQLLGKVSSVLNHGAGDILEVKPKGAAAILLPFTKTVVPTVDLTAKRIVADPPEGSVGTTNDD